MRPLRLLIIVSFAAILFAVPLQAADADDGDVLLYDQLNDGQKEVYDKILEGVQYMDTNIRLGNTGRTTLSLVYEYICCDHPELFWMDEYSEIHMRGSTVLSLNAPRMNVYDLTSKQAELSEAVSELSFTGSEYEKVKQIHDYLATTISYDIDAPHNQTLYGALVDRACVCAGFANAFKYLCGLNGISSVYVSGMVDSQPDAGHAWNMVRVDGKWYYVDTTWDNTKTFGICRYDYFLVGSETVINGSTFSQSRDSDYDYGIVAEKEAHPRYASLPSTNANYRNIDVGVYFDGKDVDHPVSMRTADLMILFSPETFNAFSKQVIAKGVKEMALITHLKESWETEEGVFRMFEIRLYIDRQIADLRDYGVTEGVDIRFNSNALALQYDRSGNMLYEGSSPFLVSGDYILIPQKVTVAGLDAVQMTVVLLVILVIMAVVVSLLVRRRARPSANALSKGQCPACGAPVEGSTDFCIYCGLRLRR